MASNTIRAARMDDNCPVPRTEVNGESVDSFGQELGIEAAVQADAQAVGTGEP